MQRALRLAFGLGLLVSCFAACSDDDSNEGPPGADAGPSGSSSSGESSSGSSGASSSGAGASGSSSGSSGSSGASSSGDLEDASADDAGADDAGSADDASIGDAGGDASVDAGPLCSGQPCGSWASSDWGVCSEACGGGEETRTNRCEREGAEIAASFCPLPAPATSRACNEEPCDDGDIDVGAYRVGGTCGVLGLLGPGFTLTSGPTTPLPVGTSILVTGSGVANIGVFSVTGGTATVTVLSPTARQITLTAALPAGATLAMRTTLSIAQAFGLNALVTLPAGFEATEAKTSGTVSSTLILCTAT